MSPRQPLSHHPQMKCCLTPPCLEGVRKRRQTSRDGEELKKIITMMPLTHRKVCNVQSKFVNGKVFPCEIRCSTLVVSVFDSMQSGSRVEHFSRSLYCSSARCNTRQWWKEEKRRKGWRVGVASKRWHPPHSTWCTVYIVVLRTSPGWFILQKPGK